MLDLELSKIKQLNRKWLVAVIILLVLIIDQGVKIWVKTNMSLGDEFPILGQNWAFIHFVENPGMAFGLKLGGTIGKVLLTVFRLIVVFIFLGMMRNMIKKLETPTALLVSFALIIAGALGNIFDSVFYGMIFSISSYHGGMAEWVSWGAGYAPILQGKVVDMLYFPMYRGVLPEWIPFKGGDYFEFFRPVFNVADTSISTGIGLFLLNHYKQSKREKAQKLEAENQNANPGTGSGVVEEE